MTTKLMSKTQQEHIEDVLLKSRMREIFTSGSVRGLIATLGLLPQQKVGYELYSTDRKGSAAMLCVLCELCGELNYN